MSARGHWYAAGAVLALAGLAITSYLTVSHYADTAPACGGVGDCHTVINSKYAMLFGIPLSLAGMTLYGALLLGNLVAVGQNLSERLGLGLISIALLGVVSSIYLTTIEIFVIEAICPYCVASGIITVLLLFSTVTAERSARREAIDATDQLSYESGADGAAG
ncbi:MAG: vitamin K epoxide reductase family protein [Chloroflexi bacterium]|nr:vitamin K epoxide reductase family protein [Chloroflexota bacterium]